MGARVALLLATVWLAGLAVLSLVGAMLLAGFPLGGPELAIAPGVAAACLGVAASIAFLASRGRRLAAVAAFAIGVAAVILLLAPAVERLLPWTGALYGISLDGLGGVFVAWALLLPPAVLLVIGSVRLWCAAGGETAMRRARIAIAVPLGIAATLIALVLVDMAAPLCPAGRTCIEAAGLSLVLPDGWSRRVADADDLFLAGKGDDRQVVIQDGQSIIGPVQSLDEVERLATEHLAQGSIGYSHQDVKAERIDLPVGPGVRVSWLSRPWFFQVDQNNTSEWFFIEGRLLVILYQDMPPESASEDFGVIRRSLRALGSS